MSSLLNTISYSSPKDSEGQKEALFVLGWYTVAEIWSSYTPEMTIFGEMRHALLKLEPSISRVPHVQSLIRNPIRIALFGRSSCILLKFHKRTLFESFPEILSF